MNKTKKKSFYIYDFSDNAEDKVFLICDHASNNVPKKYKYLGLNKSHFNSHIAYDIGVRDLTIKLARVLKCKCYLSNFSRLLIDPNRKLTDDDLIVKKTFGTLIPHNNFITMDERRFRIKNYYKDYHFNLKKTLNKLLMKKKKILLLSIHSFTKKSKNFNRPNEIGLLWNRNFNLSITFLKELQKINVNVGNNMPYSGFHLNHTLDFHTKENCLDHLSVEIRNDLICSKKGINKWVDILENIIKKTLGKNNG